MAIYCCRWMNGDISIVSASSKDDAMLKLDEFASPDDGEIFKLDEFLVDFTLTDSGTLKVNHKTGEFGFGEETLEQIMHKAYPELYREAELLDADSSEYTGKIKQAVRSERRRMYRGRKKELATDIPSRNTENPPRRGLRAVDS